MSAYNIFCDLQWQMSTKWLPTYSLELIMFMIYYPAGLHMLQCQRPTLDSNIIWILPFLTWSNKNLKGKTNPWKQKFVLFDFDHTWYEPQEDITKDLGNIRSLATQL